MSEQLKPLWYEQLKKTPWDSSENIQKQMFKVMFHASAKVPKPKRRQYPVWIGAFTVFILFVMGINGLLDGLGSSVGLVKKSDWTVSNTASKNGRIIFQAFAGGNYPSGQPNGGMWMLHLPYEQVKGSKLRIDGINKETGTTISEVPETILDSPQLAYEDLTRITSKFNLPVGGLWKFTMYLNNKKLGAVVFNVPQGWKPSGHFQFDSYSLVGIQGKLGFLDTGLSATLPKNKIMWFFWGKTDEETRLLFGKKLLISATQYGDSESIPLFSGTIGTPNLNVKPPIPDNDKVAKAPTSMSLPFTGVWRLDVTIDGKPFGSVYVKVE